MNRRKFLMFLSGLPFIPHFKSPSLQTDFYIEQILDMNIEINPNIELIDEVSIDLETNDAVNHHAIKHCDRVHNFEEIKRVFYVGYPMTVVGGGSDG